jgi:hypothetical protein
MKKDTPIYSTIHINENCIETIASFTNRAKAVAHFRRTLKNKFPQLKAKHLDIIVDEGILITRKGDTYNFVVHKNN